MSALALVALTALTAGEVAGAADFAGLELSSSNTLPAANSAVAQNTRLLVFGSRFDDGQGTTSDDVTFDRIDGATGDVTRLDVEVLAGSQPFSVVYVVDLGALPLGDFVTVTCSLCFDDWHGFVESEPDTTPPAFPVGTRSRVGVTDLGDDGWLVRACVPRPVDESAAGVALAAVTDTGTQHDLLVEGACGAEDAEVTAHATGEPRRFCFQTKAVDAAGNEALFPDDVCVDLPPHAESTGGCAATAAAPPLALALLLLAGRRSRLER